MYQSPFHFIPEATLPPDPEAARRMLALEKKKLLAEFELAGSATITLNGRELHRQDVLALFDELGHDQRLTYHQAIRKDPALLLFLEEGRLEPNGSWQADPVYDDAGFTTFISPYYAQAVDAFMQRMLAGIASLGELQALHANRSFLLPGDTEKAYRYVTRFFTEKKNELFVLRYRTDNGEPVRIGEIALWCTDQQIQLLNRLPDTFADLRYVLANTLNNLCVAYDKKKASRLALAAIERAATIRVEDEELLQLIPANLRIIRNKVGRGWYNIDPNTGKKRPKIGLIIALFIIIIRIATVGDGCNDHNRLSIRDLPVLAYREPSAEDRSFRSLLQALVKPVPLTHADSFFEDRQYQLLRPEKIGDNPFFPLFTDSLSPGRADTLFTKDTSQVLIVNESDWEAVILYQQAKLIGSSVFVPPHTTYAIRYSTHEIALQLYAGSDWNDSLMRAYDNYVTYYLPMRRIFRGGYAVRATNPYEGDTTGTPMFERRTDPGRSVADTLTLSNMGSNRIQVAYDLGEDR